MERTITRPKKRASGNVQWSWTPKAPGVTRFCVCRDWPKSRRPLPNSGSSPCVGCGSSEMSWPPAGQSLFGVEFAFWLTIVTRVPSSTTSTFGNSPFGVTVKVPGGKIGVPSASVPAAQIVLPEFEYIARSTTSCGTWLGDAGRPSTSTEKRRPWAIVLL